MVEASRQPKDKNYNLIAVLYHSSDTVESLKTYTSRTPSRRATRSWWTSSGASWRTTSRPPSRPRRCSSPGSRTSKSRGRLRAYQGAGISEEPDPRYPCFPYYVGA
jgi:hypothetical protein